MNEADLLTDAFTRIRDTVHSVVRGLDEDQLAFRVDGRANSVAWSVWHLTRIQDDHVAGVGGYEQAWTADGWYDRFGLPFDAREHGYGHTSDDMAAVRAPAELLAGYHDAVFARTSAYLQTITAADLDRVVDKNWNPPVTLGVRLVSVVNDDLQHAGQAAFVRGLL
ncbi:MAG: mycothiol transferase [Jatrophihabitantaceae bacterium]